MPNDTTTPFWKHCSLPPSFRAEEAGLTGKFSRSWPGEDSADHSHYAHDAIPEATISRLHDARHFWRSGHKTFSGFIKSREKNWGEEHERRKQREANETETGEEKPEKKPTYPSFAFVFRAQIHRRKKRKEEGRTEGERKETQANKHRRKKNRGPKPVERERERERGQTEPEKKTRK